MSERQVSKEDFITWKEDPVTKAFYEACADRSLDAKEILAAQAGLDPANDNFYRGFIYAYNEIFDFRVEENE